MKRNYRVDSHGEMNMSQYPNCVMLQIRQILKNGGSGSMLVTHEGWIGVSLACPMKPHEPQCCAGIAMWLENLLRMRVVTESQVASYHMFQQTNGGCSHQHLPILQTWRTSYAKSSFCQTSIPCQKKSGG